MLMSEQKVSQKGMGRERGERVKQLPVNLSENNR